MSPLPLVALTVDLEEWFHVCGADAHLPEAAWTRLESRARIGCERLLRLLDESGARATFFVLGFLAERDPALVREIAAAGHEIESHGHRHRRVHELAPVEFREDLRRAADAIGEATGGRPRAYRSPEWSLGRAGRWAWEVLAEEGYDLDSSVLPVGGLGDRRASPYPRWISTASGRLVEFPPTTLGLLLGRLPVTGGFGLRLSPRWAARLALRRARREGHAAMVYLHPWEFDPDHPRVPLPASRGLVHYFGLRRTEPRLRGLLRRFRFGTVREALAERPPA
jgi:polysaccharide deacetylase family protein (PEP-CTERM system associated)